MSAMESSCFRFGVGRESWCLLPGARYCRMRTASPPSWFELPRRAVARDGPRRSRAHPRGDRSRLVVEQAEVDFRVGQHGEQRGACPRRRSPRSRPSPGSRSPGTRRSDRPRRSAGPSPRLAADIAAMVSASMPVGVVGDEQAVRRWRRGRPCTCGSRARSARISASTSCSTPTSRLLPVRINCSSLIEVVPWPRAGAARALTAAPAARRWMRMRCCPEHSRPAPAVVARSGRPAAAVGRLAAAAAVAPSLVRRASARSRPALPVRGAGGTGRRVLGRRIGALPGPAPARAGPPGRAVARAERHRAASTGLDACAGSPVRAPRAATDSGHGRAARPARLDQARDRASRRASSSITNVSRPSSRARSAGLRRRSAFATISHCSGRERHLVAAQPAGRHHGGGVDRRVRPDVGQQPAAPVHLRAHGGELDAPRRAERVDRRPARSGRR